MQYSPADFMSDTPPPRPIGTECEYNVQAGKTNLYNQLVAPNRLTERGIRNHGGYVGAEHGSGRIYPDMSHAEFSTGEAVGPASAAVEDIEGIRRIGKIVADSGLEHATLYRTSGTYIPGKKDFDEGASSGYHENYLLPRSVSEDPLFDQVLPTMIASAVWSMGGALKPGYVLSQKVWGIGGFPVARYVGGQRTSHGIKPMILIPPVGNDGDTIGDSRWARAEVRMADPVKSVVNRFMSFAGKSLAIRLVEQQHRLNVEQLKSRCLANPVLAAKLYAGNLALDQKCLTIGNQYVTALDVQESFLDVLEPLGEKVAFPADEQLALGVIRGIIDALRQSDPAEASYTKLARIRTEFAPKHQFVSKGQPQSTVVASDHAVMQRLLAWDRVEPAGNGQGYWEKVEAVDPLVSHIRRFAAINGLTPRAIRRAAMVSDLGGSDTVLNWAHYRDERGNTKSLGSPIGD